MLKTNYENLTFTGDTIIELQKEFVSGTLTCSFLNNTIKKNIITKSLGGKYISLEVDPDIIPMNSILNISYKIKDELSKLSEHQRLLLIEKRLDDQEKVLKEILEALKYRVDLQTFTTWIKSLEKELGVDLIKQQFSQSR